MTAIRWKVREVAERQGIHGAAQLGERAGIAPGTATALWYGRPMRVDLPTLLRVCLVLKSTPGDLLVLETNNDGTMKGNQRASVSAGA